MFHYAGILRRGFSSWIDGGTMDRAAIEELIEKQIRPALASHGGGIELIDVKDSKVFVRLKGACGTCPMAVMTMRLGVERVLKQAFPEIEEVVSV